MKAQRLVSKLLGEVAPSGRKAVVTAQSFNRETSEPNGVARDEAVDLDNNRLFKDCKTWLDVKRAYEAFWNDLNPNSEDVVFVSQVKMPKAPIKLRGFRKEESVVEDGIPYEEYERRGVTPGDVASRAEGERQRREPDEGEVHPETAAWESLQKAIDSNGSVSLSFSGRALETLQYFITKPYHEKAQLRMKDTLVQGLTS